MIKANNSIRQWEQIKDSIILGLEKIHTTEKIFNAEFTMLLEDKLKSVSKRKHALTCMSGSHAISMSLLAHGIGAGDKVIVPNYSCPATLSSVTIIGCEPVFCEINQYGSMCTDNLSDLTNSDAKAILATGLYGDVHDHQPVKNFCDKQNILYINDAAQSQFALYNGINSLELGDVVCMSFADNKPLPVVGTYGAVLTDDDDIANNIRILRKNGKPSRLHAYTKPGFNSQPEEEKALQVLSSWKHFDQWQNRRKQITEYYDQQFAGKMQTRPRPAYSHWNYHKYAIMVPDKFKMYNILLEKGIETNRHYVDNFSELPWTPKADKVFNMTNKFIKSSLTIPSNPFMTDDEVDTVVKTILSIND